MGILWLGEGTENSIDVELVDGVEFELDLLQFSRAMASSGLCLRLSIRMFAAYPLDLAAGRCGPDAGLSAPVGRGASGGKPHRVARAVTSTDWEHGNVAKSPPGRMLPGRWIPRGHGERRASEPRSWSKKLRGSCLQG